MNGNKPANWIRKAFVPVFTALFFVFGLFFLGWLVTPLKEADYFHSEMEGFEAAGLNADVLFLGSSRIYRAFRPDVIEEKAGFDLCLVCGTNSQKLDSSYILLKDLYERIHPSTLVLGVQWNSFDIEGANAVKMENVLKAYDRLSPAAKPAFLIRNIGGEVFPELFDLYRYRADFSLDSIAQNIRSKQSFAREGYIPDTSKEFYYLSKGFNYANIHAKIGNVPIDSKGINQYDPERFNPELLDILDKIVEFCRDKEIRLVLVSPPMTLMSLYYVEDVQEAMDYFEDYAERNGLIYHNLNLLKDREAYLTDELFYDGWHFSGEGAAVVSGIYAEILKKSLNGEDVSAYFYPDLEALKQDVHRVVAVEAKFEQSGDELMIRIHSLQNEDATVLYRVELSRDYGQSYTLLRDWSEDAEYLMEMPKEDGSRIRIHAGLGPEDENAAWQVYELSRLFDLEEGGEQP